MDLEAKEHLLRTGWQLCFFLGCVRTKEAATKVLWGVKQVGLQQQGFSIREDKLGKNSELVYSRPVKISKANILVLLLYCGQSE